MVEFVSVNQDLLSVGRTHELWIFILHLRFNFIGILYFCDFLCDPMDVIFLDFGDSCKGPSFVLRDFGIFWCPDLIPRENPKPENVTKNRTETPSRS